MSPQPGSGSVRAARVVTPDGVLKAVVEYASGVITAVRPGARAGAGTIDLGDLVLLPGLVDTHVHVNAPGRDAWEGWTSASRAALAGGITTLVDMPLNSIPATVDAAAFESKRACAARESAVDFALWGGVVPGNAGALESLAAAGAPGFKCFLADSGVPEFGHVAEADLERALPVLARLGLPLLAHAEWPAALAPAAPGADPRAHATWAATRPPAAEVAAIRVLIGLAERHGAAVHVVHLAAAEALEDLRAARTRGVRVTVETCPHYLFFAAEDVPDGATEFKCAPPIRSAANRERLRRALMDGDIDLVASDHSPCPPADKRRDTGDFGAAWGGIASLEMSLGSLWSAMRGLGAGPAHIARWMAAAPARLAGLDARKGAIAPGRDADFVAWDPDASWTVDPVRLLQRHPVTPYAGARLEGVVRRVALRGTWADVAGGGAATPGTVGRLLVRGTP